MKKYLTTCFMVCLMCLVIFGIQASAATPYAANGKLSVSGDQVVNSKGKPFVIKGVSTHGLAWYPEYVNKSAFKTLRDQWGVNTIRLALYTSEYNGYCTGGNKKELKKLIDNGVKYATDLGMYVIIDWHILSDGNPLTYKSQANSFFKEIAKKYAKNGNVMYEICNEPNGSGGSWKNIKSYAKTVIQTIRKVNSKAIIIVGTPTWSQDVDLAKASPITGYKNIAYSFHFYAGTHKDAMRTKLEKVLKKGFPVIVTEFGISEASGSGTADTTEGNRWIKLLDKYKVGRVCWNLSNKNETSALLKSSNKKTSGWTSSDLSASGKWLIKSYTGKMVSPSTSSGKSSTSGLTASKSKTSIGTVKINASVKKVNSWTSNGKKYAQYSVTLKNTGSKASSNWKIQLAFKKTFKVNGSWGGDYKKSGQKLVITPLSWNKKLQKNQTTEIGFIIESSSTPAVQSVTVTAS